MIIASHVGVRKPIMLLAYCAAYGLNKQAGHAMPCRVRCVSWGVGKPTMSTKKKTQTSHANANANANSPRPFAPSPFERFASDGVNKTKPNVFYKKIHPLYTLHPWPLHHQAMMDCLYAKCIPCITDCVMAELEKLGRKYRLAMRIARDPRTTRLTCQHKGTYADDCTLVVAWECGSGCTLGMAVLMRRGCTTVQRGHAYVQCVCGVCHRCCVFMHVWLPDYFLFCLPYVSDCGSARGVALLHRPSGNHAAAPSHTRVHIHARTHTHTHARRCVLTI